MRYIAIIPAIVLVVSLAVALIGSPFSTEERGDSAPAVPPVLSVADAPADRAHSPSVAAEDVGDAEPATVASGAADKAAFVELTAAHGDAVVVDTPPAAAAATASVARPTHDATKPAAGMEHGELRTPCVPRSRRPARRFGRCR